MPFLTYICKSNPPHKTVVFVPASAMGSNTPGGGGGNPNGGVNPGTAGAAQAIINCPFDGATTAQPGDGNMSSVANGTDYNRQEQSLIRPSVAPGAPPQNSPTNIVAGTADSAIRIPIGSPGNASGLNSQALGVTVPTLLGQGFRALL